MFKILLILSLLWFCHPVFAQVTLDGTLGSKGALPGPDYQIGADVGQQHGGNLFHSFQDFNLQSHESATFSGPDNVQNIISRVTGGNSSSIDGTLRTTIPNADLYFLNPYGIMFGPNAKLDVQGGFHVSTADYLRFSDGGQFEARQPSNSLLSIAPIASFGFLTSSPAAIQVHDSNLSVPLGKTVSLIGGDLQLLNSQPPRYDATSSLLTDSLLTAPAGRINLASVSAPTTVTPTTDGLLADSAATLGKINLHNFRLDTSGIRGGDIFIRGGLLELVDSQIHSHTLGHLNGGAIDVQTENLSLQDSDIEATTFGLGRGSDIRLQVSQDLTATQVSRPQGVIYGFHAYGASGISTYTVGTDPQTGAGGNVSIQAANITLLRGSGVRARGTSPALTGSVEIKVADTFQATGDLASNLKLPLLVAGINSENHGGGSSGNIHLTTQHLRLDQGVQLSTPAMEMGQGGDITIQTDTLQLTGQEDTMGIPTSIVSTSIGQGRAGKIDITARLLTLRDGGAINAGTMHAGDGNDITVNVSDTLTISGVAKFPYIQPSNGYILPSFPSSIAANSTSFDQEGGKAGRLWVQAKHIVVQDGGSIGSFTYGGGAAGDAEVIADTITLSGAKASNGLFFHSSISNASVNPAPYAGSAGNLHVQANQITVNEGAEITTAAANFGGGNLTIAAKNLLYLPQGRVTTSVFGGHGNGGNITIENSAFVVLNRGQIKAQADEGHGGNIRIIAQQFLKTPDSLISASSRLGIDGQVQIDSPDQTIGDTLLAGANTLDVVPSLLPRPCEWATFEEYLNRSTFYVYPIAGSTLSPYDLKPSLGVRFIPKLSTVGQASVSKMRTGDGKQRLAWLTECQRLAKN